MLEEASSTREDKEHKKKSKTGAKKREKRDVYSPQMSSLYGIKNAYVRHTFMMRPTKMVIVSNISKLEKATSYRENKMKITPNATHDFL